MGAKNPFINLFRTMWQYSKGNRGMVILFSVLETFANIILLADAIVVARAFNDVQFSSSDPKLLHNLIFNLSLLLAIILVFWLLHGISRVIERENAFLMRKNYKEAMISKVLALPFEWHKNHHSGETIDKINKSATSLYDFASDTFMVNSAVVRILGSLIAIVFFDYHAAIIAIVVTVVALSIMLRFDTVIRRTLVSIYKSENHLASAIHDYITNIFSIITLRLKSRVEREVSERSLDALPDFKKNISMNEVKWFSIGFLTTLMTFVVLSWNAYSSFYTTGFVVIGTLFALYKYLQNIGSVFSTFAFQYGKIVQQDTAVRAAFIITEEYEKIPHKSEVVLPGNWQELTIRNMFFTYVTQNGERAETHHLEDVNLTISRGQKIAFIGESGSGKSTTLALLRGLYEPERAELLCDNVKLDRGIEALYNYVTLIPQEPELFNSTVYDNITMDTQVDERVLLNVIEIAQFKSVLDRLPNGLKTYVMEKGVSLSGGEKQRLALARGLLAARDSDFVFMDEPTSSVDFVNEVKIYENVLDAFKDKTVVSTVHNLSLLKYFDYVYLFAQGKIAAHGTFEEIIGSTDFKTIWNRYNKKSNE